MKEQRREIKIHRCLCDGNRVICNIAPDREIIDDWKDIEGFDLSTVKHSSTETKLFAARLTYNGKVVYRILNELFECHYCDSKISIGPLCLKDD